MSELRGTIRMLRCSLFRWYQQHLRVPFRESFLPSLNHLTRADQMIE
jgi:hypothetical protein